MYPAKICENCQQVMQLESEELSSMFHLFIIYWCPDCGSLGITDGSENFLEFKTPKKLTEKK